MILLPILGVAEQALKLVNTLLEDVPPGMRQARMMIWFHLWWPAGKGLLKLVDTPPEVIQQIERLAAEEPPK